VSSLVFFLAWAWPSPRSTSSHCSFPRKARGFPGKNSMNARRINLVHRSLSRPLTILGAERKLFFFAMCLGAGTFNLLGGLLGGLLMFLPKLASVLFSRPAHCSSSVRRCGLTER
jgi:type IV secretory pathway TrbD component